MTTPTASATTGIAPRRAALATAAALVLNLIVLAAANALDVSLDTGTGEPVGVLPVILSSVVPLALGFVVVGLVVRRAPRLRGPAAWAGLALALLTIAAPVAAAADTGTAVSLALMHVVVGAAWFAVVRPGR